MKNKMLPILLSVLFLLTSCGEQTDNKVNIAVGDMVSYSMKTTVSYMTNYSKNTFTTSDSLQATSDSLLFKQEEVTLPCYLSKPTTDPIRTGYDFTGWYEDREATNEWNFQTEQATSNLFLYAGWEKGKEETYVEPDFISEESIDDTLSAPIRVDGILNVSLLSNQAYLTKGAIYRLEENKDDVSFSLNITKKTGAKIDNAVYDAESKIITVKSSLGELKDTSSIQVVDNSSNYVLTNSTYESKAQAYEAKDKNSSNYHVMLAGSSSFEFWTNSEADLSPIVSYNHGIGGTTLDDWNNSLFERLVAPYSPKCVVYYLGVNDLVNSGQSKEQVIASAQTLVEKTHSRLSQAHVFFLAINRLPGYYLSYNPTIEEVNNSLCNYIADKNWASFIDPGTSLLKESGDPDAAYFRNDCLHMSEYGYVIWAKQIKDALKKWLK